MSEFDKNKSHEENVKKSIDLVLGVKTTPKKSRKKYDDTRKAEFMTFIDNLMFIELRTMDLEETFGINLDSYNNHYNQAIGSLLSLMFNKKQVQLIYFYVYDRHLPDGTLVDLMDEEGNVIPLNSVHDLWDLIKVTK
jgi:hypothetical protein